jgi:hypothetical protein
MIDKTVPCIYCLQDKPLGAFHVEHVIPQALGTFENNLTLNYSVCKDCNQFFGDNLEIVLTRGTIEAIHRLEYGIKPLSEVRDLKYHQLTLTITAPGDWYGVKVHLVVEGDPPKLVIEPLPQVGFLRKSTSEWQYFTEVEIQNSKLVTDEDLDKKTAIEILARSEAQEDRIKELLKEQGIDFQKIGEIRRFLPS